MADNQGFYSTPVGAAGTAAAANNTPPAQNPDDTYGLNNGGGGAGAGSGGGGGGGGGGSSTEPTEEQKKAAGHLGGIVGWNAQTLLDAAKHADEIFDISDRQNKSLWEHESKQNRRSATADWAANQIKLQNVASQLRHAQGNALRGSNLYTMLDLLARKDDLDDVEVLTTLAENLDQVNNDYYKALMATNNSRNEMYSDTEKDLRDLMGDYAAQMNSIHPDTADELIDSENHTLKPPDWLQTEYYEEHKRPEIQAQSRGWIRPANFADEVWGPNQVTNNRQPNLAQAGSRDYWSRMYSGYERRA